VEAVEYFLFPLSAPLEVSCFRVRFLFLILGILCFRFQLRKKLVLVVLSDPFQGMGAWRNSTETQQSGHAPRTGPEVKNGRSGAEDGASERLGCGTVMKEVSQILQRVSAGAACRTLLPFYPA